METIDALSGDAGTAAGFMEGLSNIGPHYYFSWVCVILVCALPSLTSCTMIMREQWSRLPPTVRGLCLPLAWDWWMVVAFLLRDCYSVKIGQLQEGLWCQAMGFVNIAGVLALRTCAAINAYATARLAKGHQLPDAQLYGMYALAVMGGIMLASLFLVTDSYGPYKGLYCCLKETAYVPLATVPCFLVTFSSMASVIYFYFQALNTSACTASEKPVIDVLVRRGLVHGFTFYLLWSPIIAAGTLTALGGKVPLSFDIGAAWVVKLEALVDSLLIMETINMVMHPPACAGLAKDLA